MGYIAINNSGASQTVWNYEMNQSLGKLLPREVYAIGGAHPTQYDVVRVKFRNASGNAATGYVYMGVQGIDLPFTAYPASTNSFYDYTSHSYDEYAVWNVRRATKIYGPDGVTVHATINAGGQVAAPINNGGQSGSSNIDWLLVKYFKQPGGSWTSMYEKTNNAAKHGFAPIGLEYGSMTNTLSVYGTA